MFPTPIAKKSARAQTIYKVFLPIALFIWLLPLIAIFMTSIRPGSDITMGNVFGWPSSFQMLENYTAVFRESKAVLYLWNSFKITVPTVIISVSLAAMAGYALAIYRFRFSMALFF
ncbi:carbohydrate ABC transporter permease, partial [Rhizobiaceae bacterium]|nr:carbohydrate ABC transporter permease [Rhizobiaceae bacterium]